MVSIDSSVSLDLCVDISISFLLTMVRGLFISIVVNVKRLVGAFNQEKVLIGAFYVIVKTSR